MRILSFFILFYYKKGLYNFNIYLDNLINFFLIILKPYKKLKKSIFIYNFVCLKIKVRFF